MKNLYKRPLASLLGIIAIGAVIAAGLAGCGNLSGDDENTDPKNLVITGITAELYAQGAGGIQIGIVQAGTAPEQAIQGTGIAAVADSVTPLSNTPPYSIRAELYAALDYESRWTGSGKYDVYLELSNGGGTTYYRAQNVSFTSATTSVAITAFSALASPPSNNENTDPKTLVITGITAELYEQGEDGIQIGIIQAGTAPEQALQGIGIAAVADSVTPLSSAPPYSIRAELYAAPDYASRWTGSGGYDVYLTLSNGGGTTYYRAENVSFTSATTPVAITAFSMLLAGILL
ncbi:MAG: hypothetical protein LBP32_02855 [Spirochaetaceae bacterium]|jgi:hypothetical protein|nr:hypothetical protein [Spirochaetaceae bacterium]